MHGQSWDGRFTGSHPRVRASKILTTAPRRKTKLAPFPKEVTKARYPRSPIRWVISGWAPRAHACPAYGSEGSLEGERSRRPRWRLSINSPPERVSWCILGKTSRRILGGRSRRQFSKLFGPQEALIHFRLSR